MNLQIGNPHARNYEDFMPPPDVVEWIRCRADVREASLTAATARREFDEVLRAYVTACGAVRRSELAFHASSTIAEAEDAAEKWQGACANQRRERRRLIAVELKMKHSSCELDELLERLECAS